MTTPAPSPDPGPRPGRRLPSLRLAVAPLALLPLALLPLDRWRAARSPELLASAAGTAVAAGTALAPGTVAAPGVPEAPAGGPLLRVLLRQDAQLDLGAQAGPVRLAAADGRPLLEVQPGDRLLLRPGADGSGFTVELQAQDPARSRGLELPLAELWLNPRRERQRQSLLLIQAKPYRGRLQLRSAGGSLQAINHVPLESYLASVVGSEMPASWPLDALRAQAVAARTYALAQRKPAAAFDLKATVASQMYRGVVAETASTRQAVAGTSGLVLMHGGALINAVFHSSSGGSTENSGEIWSRQLPYLVSVPDFDQESPVARWQQRFDPLQLRQAFRETAGVSRIDVLATSSSGRIRRARVIGPAGMVEVSGSELRQRLGLRSTLVNLSLEAAAAPAEGWGGTGRRLLAGGTPPPPPPPPSEGWFDAASGPAGEGGAAAGSPQAAVEAPAFATAAAPLALPSLLVSGRGFGHGVGMSQWGAHALAQRGRSYQEILRHYYRGAELRSLPTP